jgi:hypothetical protein
MDLDNRSDDEARTQLRDGLRERLEAALTNQRAVIVRREPHVFSLDANGSLLMISEGDGERLLNGRVDWPHRSDGDQDAPWEFTVSRGTEPSQLHLITRGGPTETGAPAEILDNIVRTFLEQATPR